MDFTASLQSLDSGRLSHAPHSQPGGLAHWKLQQPGKASSHKNHKKWTDCLMFPLHHRIKLGPSPSRYICRGSSLKFAGSLTMDNTVSKIVGTRDTDKVYNMNVKILKGAQLQEQFWLAIVPEKRTMDRTALKYLFPTRDGSVRKPHWLLTKLCIRGQPVGRGRTACPAVFCNSAVVKERKCTEDL